MILNILSHVENSSMEDEMEKCRKELQKYQVHYQKNIQIMNIIKELSQL